MKMWRDTLGRLVKKGLLDEMILHWDLKNKEESAL